MTFYSLENFFHIKNHHGFFDFLRGISYLHSNMVHISLIRQSTIFSSLWTIVFVFSATPSQSSRLGPSRASILLTQCCIVELFREFIGPLQSLIHALWVWKLTQLNILWEISMSKKLIKSSRLELFVWKLPICGTILNEWNKWVVTNVQLNEAKSWTYLKHVKKK
jgi:hypothetical protein